MRSYSDISHSQMNTACNFAGLKETVLYDTVYGNSSLQNDHCDNLLLEFGLPEIRLLHMLF